jgi:hypothetical protein
VALRTNDRVVLFAPAACLALQASAPVVPEEEAWVLFFLPMRTLPPPHWDFATEVNYLKGGRTRSAFASDNFSPYCYGQATAYLPLCSDGQCEDGRFEAENEGTTEYCPIAFAFVAAVAAQGSQVVEAFKYISRAWWDPAGPIDRQNGTSSFYLRGGRSSGCQASSILLGHAFSQRPSDRKKQIQFSALPADNTQACSANPECEVYWTVETSTVNEGSGYIDGTGRIDGPSTCPTRGDSIKQASIQVQ